MGDSPLIVSMRVAECKHAVNGSSIQNCELCRAPIYVSPGSRRRAGTKRPRAICLNCFEVKLNQGLPQGTKLEAADMEEFLQAVGLMNKPGSS